MLKVIFFKLKKNHGLMETIKKKIIVFININLNIDRPN